MAITRRQFVTRLGALAGAMGLSQADLSKISEAFAHGSAWATPAKWYTKPKVVWIHGAECTGCSTSFLGFFEDVQGTAVDFGTSVVKTADALDMVGGGAGAYPWNALLTANSGLGHPYAHRTLNKVYAKSHTDVDGDASNSDYIANVADVVIDFLDVQYHETVQCAGGPLAYENLAYHKTGDAPFVLVVEGAVQPPDSSTTGAWGDAGSTTQAWCAIGMDESGNEHEFSSTVNTLASSANCVAVVAIGQCACYGGYPGCKNYTQEYNSAWNSSTLAGKRSQTGAVGVYDYLKSANPGMEAKVINSPGCPTNPWWFVLTVVAFLADFTKLPTALGSVGPLGILERTVDGSSTAVGVRAAAVDSGRRLRAVYPVTVHGPHCPRYNKFLAGDFALVQGDKGCLQKIGCKGPATMSSCGMHGWNAQQPQNAKDSGVEFDLGRFNETASGSGTYRGTFCVAAGHPCMACTQKGYPDNFVPFIKR